MKRSYYDVLGVDRQASQEEIQHAYRRLARRHHPDISTAPDADTVFKEINEAYEVLCDPSSRALYDRYGQRWREVRQRQQTAAGGSQAPTRGRRVPVRTPGERGGDPSAQSGQRETAHQGADVEVAITLAVDDAYLGGRRRITVTGPGGTRNYDVCFPAGASHGTRVRVPGLGEPGRGGSPDGDLYLVVHLAPHPKLRVTGRDVEVDLHVAPWEAALGAAVPVQLPTGPVMVTLPPGSSCGTRLHLPGHGLPSRNGSSGDLIAKVKIVMPTSLTTIERKLFQRLAERSSFDPRNVA